MKIILGSKSPRRAEILHFFSVPFVQMASEVDEEAFLFDGDIVSYVSNLSKAKAASLAEKMPKDLIITADTVVFGKGKVFNKPRDENEAVSFLRELSGNWHEVLTSVTAQKGKIQYTEVESTKILFHKATEEQLHIYVRYFHTLDKAGAYGIQEGGGILIERMEGCFYNVMGLPINGLKNVLQKMGVDLWNFLKK